MAGDNDSRYPSNGPCSVDQRGGGVAHGAGAAPSLGRCSCRSVALCLALRRGATEPQIRLVGLLLQLFGIGTVAWGIYETRKLFSQAKLVDQLRGWLRRFPVYGGRVVSANLSITVPGASLEGRGYVSEVVGTGVPLEARVQSLENNMRLTNTRIDQTQNEMDRRFRSQADLLKLEEQARAQHDEVLGTTLRASGTGGLYISAMGALWLFVGVTLSTAAPEIAKCLN
jgi:hypothetical protein